MTSARVDRPQHRQVRPRPRSALAACALVAVVTLGVACGPREQEAGPHESVPRLSPVRSLAAGSTDGFERALLPRPFVFPADNGPHPEYRTEWWYFTGNLEAADGRRFGYQLTFFRSALAPPDSEPLEAASAWTTGQVYMAHLGVTDAAAGRFHSFERFNRGAAGLAGAVAEPHRVWLDSWEVMAVDAEQGSVHSTPPLRLRAAERDVGLDLRLAPRREPVFHGESGLSRKGSEPGNASYYFSITRWATSGTVRTPDGRVEVQGSSWMDREWSTSVLEAGQVGWDWFSLQLDDGSDLMVFELRRADGTVDSASAGTLVEADGTVRHLTRHDVEVSVLGRWTSPRSGGVYPAAWRLSVPEDDMVLELRPLVADQEHRGAFAYWEGAVDAVGTRDGRTITGRGYVELTGYAGE